jgi:hypothetical protein
MKTNLYAMFWLCKMALPHMSAGSPSSTRRRCSPPRRHLSCSTTRRPRPGIANFTRGLATMVAPEGIRVNSVAPGPIWTPLIPATMPAEKVESFGEQVPLARAGQPAEVATAFVFLASDEASYITARCSRSPEDSRSTSEQSRTRVPRRSTSTSGGRRGPRRGPGNGQSSECRDGLRRVLRVIDVSISPSVTHTPKRYRAQL